MAKSTEIDGVLWGNYTPGKAPSKLVTGAKYDNNLDKDAFLKLLMAQMKYQDPLNPMDDKGFIAQMAQLTALAQRQNLNASQAKTQAYNMSSHTVTGTTYNEDTNTSKYVEGVVTAVKRINAEP